jgi:raffinose/stachyose/melibiose transport system permease protein
MLSEIKSVSTQVLKAKWVYITLLPGLLFILIFMVYPVFHAFAMSMTDWRMSDFNNPDFVGIDNFIRIFKDPLFWKSMMNLLIFIVWGFVSTMCWMLPVTYLVFKLGTGFAGRFFQRAYIFPMMVPGMVITLFWKFFYEPNYGMLNSILRLADKEEWAMIWLGDQRTALAALLFTGFPWIGGFGFLVILAGFQSIDSNIHEASVIDGANAFRQFTRIDLPLIIPQIKILVMLGMINGIQQYTNQMIMTNGGPNYSTYVPGLMMYKSAFNHGKLGYGAAIGVILFFLIFLFTIFANKRIKSAV